MPVLLSALLLPFIGAAVAALLPTHRRNAASGWAALVGLVDTILIAMQWPAVRDGDIVAERWSWLPAAGLELVIRLDGFAWMFSMLVLGIGTLVAVYARYYMSPDDPIARFFAFFLAFMGAMLGVVLAGNLIQLAFFWELTSIFSFLLIGYWYHRRDARRGARMALTVTGAGGLAMLAGMLILGNIAGSYDLDVVLARAGRIQQDPLYAPMMVLVALGALTKSAQFPFHFWLPRAMAAPTPVSAYLHSATMVKAGVFLLARLWPVLSGTPLWFYLIGGAGLITLLLGAYGALHQRDLKGLLAYSTISHLGLITLLLALNSKLAAVAAVFHIINHATFKASMFMAAGIVDHETGTRDMNRLSGLFKAMPITGTLAIVASAAMAGVPLLNGFLSKEMFFAETVDLSSRPWVETLLPAVATLAGLFAVVYALRIAHGVFFGPPAQRLPREPHEPIRWMRLPIEALVLLCLAVGIFPQTVIGPVLAAAAQPVVGGNLPEYSLAVWHGWNKALQMSIVAMVGGIALYAFLYRRRHAAGAQGAPFAMAPSTSTISAGDMLPAIGPDGQRVFEHLTARLTYAARWMARHFGPSRMQPQMLLLVLTALVAGALAMRGIVLEAGVRPRVPATLEFALLWIVGGICAVGAAWNAKFHRLIALTLLGGTGLVVCLTFVWFSAPDLALTQLSVEVVTLVLFLLGLRWLPQRQIDAGEFVTLRARGRRLRDFIVCVSAGAGLAALSYAMLTRPSSQSISPFFLANALPGGGGTNVVNVMLVDFRSLDTFGEVVVIGVVALTVFALLLRFRPLKESVAPPRQQTIVRTTQANDLQSPSGVEGVGVAYLLVPATLARLLLPTALLFALHLLIRGHNEPGGGFVAGILVALAVLTQYMIAGTTWVEEHLPLRPARWIAMGLLIAGLTGLGSIVLGYPFLTSHTLHWNLPVFGEVHFASAMFFDLGVFAAVVGSTLLMLVALAHQSLRAARSGQRPQPTNEGD